MTESAYQGGGGMYNTSESAYSMFPRRDKTRRALEMGKMYLMKEMKQKEKEENMKHRKEKQLNNNPEQRRAAEEQDLEKEVIKAYRHRQENMDRIGSFKFDIDNDLDVEILTSDQVFEDLDDIKNIREKTGDPDSNNSAYKSLIMAMYTRGKKKKKR